MQVLAAVDNLLMRAGLQHVLSTRAGLTVVHCTEASVLRQARSLRPDVVLIDLEPGPPELTALCALAPVLAFTHDRPGVIHRALHAGVTACLVHGQFTAEELINATMTRRTSRTTRLAELSRRETETMDLVARGLSNEEIADKLTVSVKTIKNHINSIFAKLAARHRAEAVAIWVGTHSSAA